MTSPNKKNPPEKNTSQKTKKGQTTKQLLHTHLQDKNHTITGEDIENLDLKLGNPDRSTSHTPDLPSGEERPKDEDKDPKIVIPWDLIDG